MSMSIKIFSMIRTAELSQATEKGSELVLFKCKQNNALQVLGGKFKATKCNKDIDTERRIPLPME